MPIRRGTFKISNRREKYIKNIIDFQTHIYTYISKYYFQKSLYAYCYIYPWLVMIKYFVIRNFRGISSSVEMLKECVIRERLGAPTLKRLLSSTESLYFYDFRKETIVSSDASSYGPGSVSLQKQGSGKGILLLLPHARSTTQKSAIRKLKRKLWL